MRKPSLTPHTNVSPALATSLEKNALRNEARRLLESIMRTRSATELQKLIEYLDAA